MLGLTPDGTAERDPEPGEIVRDGGDQVRARAHRIDILDPQDEVAAEPCGDHLVHQGGIGVSEMEAPVGARREAKADRNGRPGHPPEWRWHSSALGTQAIPGMEQAIPSP